MLKGYKHWLYPTEGQAEFLIKTIGCARFVYNKLHHDRDVNASLNLLRLAD